MPIEQREDGSVMICPVCEFDYVHPVEVRVSPVLGEQEIVITHTGTKANATDFARSVRGVHIWLTFRCESGHQWHEQIAFYKGQTLIETHVSKTEQPDRPTIWRD